jgi:hypothetical protein
MGAPDQLFKFMLEYEAPLVTNDAAHFDRSPEFATAELRPDGVLSTRAPNMLRTMLAPWCLLTWHAVLDAKMPGDHVDHATLQRCVARRELWQAQRLSEVEVDPDPLHCGAWLVAPHLAQWILTWRREGRLTLTEAGQGVWLLGPSMSPIVWIAANELPLDETLVPFLMARSGTALEAFFRWAVGRKPPEWFKHVITYNPEVARMMPEFNIEMSHEQREQVRSALRRAVELDPAIGEPLIARGLERGLGPLEHVFARKLRRALTPNEHVTLLRRLDTHGAARLGDVVLDLDAEALSAWLHDANAT